MFQSYSWVGSTKGMLSLCENMLQYIPYIIWFILWLKPGLLGRVRIIRLRLKITIRYDISFQGDINLRQKVQGAGRKENHKIKLLNLD